MKYKRLRYSHGHAEAVVLQKQFTTPLLRRPIKRRLISLSPTSESLAPSSDSFVNPTKTIRYAVILPYTAAILSAIFEFVIGFVSNFYNSCALSLRTIPHKNEVSVLINDGVTANYSVSRRPFCPPSWKL